ncbi:hypothetical protein CHH72_21535 [Shouchella clausii]|uniref:Glycosyltransferase 2-like domain-containing protein n=2 Tax=Shouchella clausii TaxID=79880 RepID=A0A268NUN0_SHOCL|nr:hypothetical protein CHH72_21535 [Shouchella clausii]
MKIMENVGSPKYTFSIVMAIYNVENYLEEAIESVVNQTIGFKEHVQLILVNDGSPDNSEEICTAYQEKFPNNVVYIKQENAGVSVARNTGIQVAEGKYINFLDSDDYFDLDVLEKVKNFFDLHGEEIDLVAIPLIFFEGKQGPHMLHYKFNKTRVIDVEVEYEAIQLQSGSTFIHRENGLGDLRFQPGQKYGEDGSLLTDIIMKKRKFGVLHDTVYNYRARAAGTSALQGSKTSYDYYFPTIDMYYIPKLEKYCDLYHGRVPKYVQFVVMYDMQWRLREKVIPEVLENEMDGYIERILHILKFIDEDIIWKQRYLNWYQKHALVNMKQRNKFFGLEDEFYQAEKVTTPVESTKSEVEVAEDIVVKDYKGNIKDCLSKRNTVDIFLCEVEGEHLLIVGRLGSLLPQAEMAVYFRNFKGQVFKAESYHFPNDQSFIAGHPIYDYFGFQFRIPLKELKLAKKWILSLDVNGVEKRVGVKFSASARLSNKLKNGYMDANHEIMIWFNHAAQRFDVKKYSVLNMLKKERKVKLELKRKKVKNYSKISRTRILIRLLKRFKKSEINLFMDRIDKADDSAECLLEYYEQQQNKKQRNYYAIKKTSSDYDRLKTKYNVIDYKSYKHKIIFLLSDKLISSHADRFIYQPFTGTENYFKDLKEYKYVFLQHGIINGDLSNWLKKHDKNFKLFATSSTHEYRSIVEGNYGYTDKEVKLTGLPRYDRLTDDQKEKVILVMPTWRRHLVKEFSNKVNGRPYSETFKESQYFERWNHLLNDPRLLNHLKEKGYRLLFVPHPSIRQQLDDFTLSNVDVAAYNDSYSQLFRKGSLLITDYSSVFFDFAYMKKPLFYYQFDDGNWSSGYFSFTDMGFGEVIDNHEELVSKIIDTVNSNVEMEEKYKQRVESFFAHIDKQNCKRMYDEINKL